MTMFSTWQYEVKMEDVEAAEMVISMRLVVLQCQVWQQCTLRHQSPSTSGHQLNLSPAIQLCNTWTCDMRHVTCYVWLITQYVWLSAIQLCHNWPRQLCSTQLVFSVDQGPYNWAWAKVQMWSEFWMDIFPFSGWISAVEEGWGWRNK